MPLSKYPFHHPSPTVKSAFDLCRLSEFQVTNKLDPSAQLTEATRKKLEKELYHIRLAGYLLVFSLTDTHTAEVTRSIVSGRQIVELGAFYDQHFVRTCKTSHPLRCLAFDLLSIWSVRRIKGRTPQPSNHPSRNSSDFAVDQLMDQLALLPCPTNHQEAKKYVRAPSLFFFTPHDYALRPCIATPTAVCSLARLIVNIFTLFRSQKPRT